MRDLFPLYNMTAPLFPMNAKKYGKKPTTTLEALIKDPKYWAEVKLDGARATTAEGRFFSRHASEDKSCPETIGFPVENTERIPHLSALFEQIHGHWFDGEICYVKNGVMNSDAVTSILGCTPEKAITRQTEGGFLSYVIFDVLFVDYKNVMGASLFDRRELLEAVYDDNNLLFREYEEQFQCKISLSQVARTQKEKELLLTYAQDNNLEGLMFKHIEKDYRPDKRPEGYWYKVKKELDADVVIMGFTEGKGKFSGMVGSIEFGQYKKATKFPGVDTEEIAVMNDGFYVLTKCGSCSGMDDSFRMELTKNADSYIGKVITITAMERTKAGQFRHPQFQRVRTDKQRQQCIWGEC